MNNLECVGFLQWALPRMDLHWPGFRKVRGVVCKRVDRRRRALGLATLAAYRDYLGANPDEWASLRALCSIPISRFYRDQGVFDALEHAVLPALAGAAAERPGRTLNCWSAGCASGEEPYTLAILWRLRLAERHPGLAFRVLATDVDEGLLGRAAIACYSWSSLREVPAEWREQGFERRDGTHCVRQRFRTMVAFARQDLREEVPDERFDLVLCRNVALTYFEPELQRRVVRRIAGALHVGGALVVGIHESLPPSIDELVPWPGTRAVFRRLPVAPDAEI
ncbi:MAG TPA: protein-glutamate O-methyltransferase CheR [Burkholderiales bacterium]|jgi:chemotaxis protein methyltransferase CheR